MKKVLCGIVMGALMATTVPMSAAERPAVESLNVKPIAGALKDAGQTVTPRVEAANVSASTKVPVALPRTGSGRVRRSAAMMVTTLVTTAAGAAASIYMVKQMQKNTDQK
ncbi:MAG: hypothetical protein ABIX28_24310 [Vicinamibacterales bacterium]